MPAPAKTLTGYIPAIVARRFEDNPRLIIKPTARYLPGAVLGIHISGLATLIKRLSTHGPAGSEELTNLLKINYERLVDLFVTHGGDVIKFSGDMLLALWTTEPTDKTLETAVVRAAQCGLAIQATLHNERITQDLTLSFKIAIGAGDVLTTDLGGVYGRWEFLVSGQPLAQIKQAEPYTQPGRVTFSPEAWRLVQDQCGGQPLVNGFVQLQTVKQPIPPTALSLPALTPQAEAALRGYVPAAFLSRLGSIQTSMFAELLPITVLQIRLPDLNYTTPPEQTHKVIRLLQTILYEYEGSVDKISMDDEGTYLAAILGLPPVAHEDDSLRSMQLAFAMREALEEVHLRGLIGIATGRAFCGVVGNDYRREYTILGEAVRLAEQLMWTAGQNISPAKNSAVAVQNLVSILCDEPTYKAIKDQFAIERLGPLTLEEDQTPVLAYKPTAYSSSPQTDGSRL